MKKVKAILEVASDGTYHVYSDSDEINYMCLGTGENPSDAFADFLRSCREMEYVYKKRNEPFEEVEFVYELDEKSILDYMHKLVKDFKTYPYAYMYK